MRAALLAAKTATRIPVICQLSYSEDGRTVTGTDPQSAAILLEAMGANIIGVNCSLGPEELVPVVKTLSENCTCPISVLPNAGMPYLKDGQTVFPMGPEDFGKWGVKLLEAGAPYLGGCCGTTPEHIRHLARAVKGCSLPERKLPAKKLWLTSRSKSVCIDKNLPTRLIGERINPTGKKKCKEALLAGKTSCKTCCAASRTLVYCTSGGRYYHSKTNCSGMENASAVTLSEALVLGKQACPTCKPLSVNTSSSSAESQASDYYVYATVNGKYYHIKSNCSGMSGAQKITLKQAITLGKSACPTCS